MPEYASDVIFHVQAGTRIGMGHLSRSRAVITALQDMGFNCKLHLDADAQGVGKAREWGLAPIDTLPATPSALVIDAITLDRVQADIIRRYGPRILISPVFSHADIVSHALLRAASSALFRNLSDSAKLHIKTDYAFATAHGLRPSALDFAKLEVGMCLSGGVDPMDPKGVLTLLDELPQVAGIKMIDPRRIESIETPLQHVPRTKRPWDFLRGINLFIGGHGVMLAEAIAQGLPAISLSTRTGDAKNSVLQESGALRVIARDARMLLELKTILNDRIKLEEMHRASLNLDGAGRATCLAQDIRAILKESD